MNEYDARKTGFVPKSEYAKQNNLTERQVEYRAISGFIPRAFINRKLWIRTGWLHCSKYANKINRSMRTVRSMVERGELEKFKHDNRVYIKVINNNE
jgi:hypothetical protein